MTELNSPSSEGTPSLGLPPHLRKTRLRPSDALEYLDLAHGVKVAESTLAKWRSVGGGPAFQKMGRAVLYPVSGLDGWVSSRLGAPVTSTSEQPGGH